MVFRRFVEVGRVVLVNYGPDMGKLATIIDVVDANRVLIDGPNAITGVPRQVISLKRVILTPQLVKIPHSCRERTLVAAWKAADTLAKWNKTAWARKLALREKRANCTDFERFKLIVAKRTVNSEVRTQLRSQIRAILGKRRQTILSGRGKSKATLEAIKAKKAAFQARKAKRAAAPKAQ
eukprot:m51a1_g6639 putative 60S ribosomal protein L14e (180) ;mRNA; f:107658-108346